MLGIPTVTDRVIQQAIAQVLTPIFDPEFSASSFGFRPGRNAHQAVRQVQTTIEAGYRIAVDLDLAKFFDTVNHDLLIRLLGRRIRDKRLLALIGRYLRAGVLVGEQVLPSAIGTPHGGPLAPLLANILLHQLDCELERRGHRFARYADDLLVLVKSQRAGERVKPDALPWTKLTVTKPKAKCTGARMRLPELYLPRQEITLDGCGRADFKHQVRTLTGRSWGVSMDYRLFNLRQYVRGWMGYFGVSQYYRPIPELDDWLRRRIRMCYWKQWRLCRTKIRHLRKLGVSLQMAIQHAVSSKSYWHMARTPALQFAISNAWLKAQGLVSVRDLWRKAQGYAF